MGLLDSFKSMLGGKSSGRAIDLEGRFQLERTAVTGTMAKFFAAKDSNNDNQVVGVKVLDPEKVEAFEGRFKQFKKPSEGQIALGMHHPNVVETYEVGVSTKGFPVIIMEFVRGPVLQNVIVKKQEQHLAGKRLKLIKSMAEALKYVHQQEFIHRDICPRNFILLPGSEDIKLIDFGLTVPAEPPYMAPGNRTGTPLYMSPEVVRRRPTDKRVDIFSLGVTFYCMIGYKHPWQGDDVPGRAALNHDTREPKELTDTCPNVNPALARIIMKMIEPQADDRTRSITDFLDSYRRIKEIYQDDAPSPVAG